MTPIKPPAKTKVKPGTLYEVLPDGRWAFYMDNLMLESFGNCEQKFKHRHIDHLEPKGPKGWGLSVGLWWHDVLAWAYTKMKDDKVMPSLEDFLLHAGATWQSLGMNEYERTHPVQYKRFNGYKGALLMADRYYSNQLPYDFANWGIIAVEVGFGYDQEALIGENDLVVLYYAGRMDLLIEQRGRVEPVDHKTVDYVDSKINEKYKPHDATLGYIISAEHVAKRLGYDVEIDRCIINVCARQEPGKPDKPRFVKVYPHYSTDEIEEWKRRRLKRLTRLRWCIENDSWDWNTSSCHLYNGCEYRTIDGAGPKTRPIQIESNYENKGPWIPYQGGE